MSSAKRKPSQNEKQKYFSEEEVNKILRNYDEFVNMRLPDDWELKDCWERFGMSRTTFYHYKKKRDDLVKETGEITSIVRVRKHGRAARVSKEGMEIVRQRIVAFAQENNLNPLEVPNDKVDNIVREQIMYETNSPTCDIQFPESHAKRIKYSFGFTGRKNVYNKKSKPHPRGANPIYCELLNNPTPLFAKDPNQRIKDALKMYDDYYAGMMPKDWKLSDCYEKAGVKRTSFWSHKQKRDQLRERGQYYDPMKLRTRCGRPDLLSDEGVRNIREKLFKKSAELDVSVNRLGDFLLPYLVEEMRAEKGDPDFNLEMSATTLRRIRMRVGIAPASKSRLMKKSGMKRKRVQGGMIGEEEEEDMSGLAVMKKSRRDFGDYNFDASQHFTDEDRANLASARIVDRGVGHSKKPGSDPPCQQLMAAHTLVVGEDMEHEVEESDEESEV